VLFWIRKTLVTFLLYKFVFSFSVTTGFTSATVTSAAAELVIQNVLTLKKQNAWKKPGIGSSSGESQLIFMNARTMIQS
jgi:hypothetical protein